MERTYRVYLKLSEPEAVAVARLAKQEMRDLRRQAHFLLRQKLVELNMLTEDPPATTKTQSPEERSQENV